MRPMVLGTGERVRANSKQWRDIDPSLFGPVGMWIGGVVVPIAVALYGLGCIACGEITIVGQVATVVWYGTNAVAAGIALIAFAGLLHCQIFWDSLYDSTRAGARSKFCCLLVIGVCAYYICIHAGVFQVNG